MKIRQVTTQGCADGWSRGVLRSLASVLVWLREGEGHGAIRVCDSLLPRHRIRVLRLLGGLVNSGAWLAIGAGLCSRCDGCVYSGCLNDVKRYWCFRICFFFSSSLDSLSRKSHRKWNELTPPSHALDVPPGRLWSSCRRRRPLPRHMTPCPGAG